MILRTEVRRSRRAAFTLMEMLIVVAIIVILAGTGGFYLMGAFGDAQKSIAQTKTKSLTDACNAYKLKHNGQYPDSLETLLQADAKGGPWLEDRDALKDPWEKTYLYDRTGPRNNGRKPDIWTVGPDGVEVGNWPATPQ